jgi:dTDP-glucose 4,6-dehydratase
VTHIAHFAAESHVDRSILGPRAFLDTNVAGSYAMLEAAREARDQDGLSIRFLHVSTDEVFGSLPAGAKPSDESAKYAPNSPYSASKAASDHFARAWQKTYGLDVVITNCSNNYGPWQFPEKLIPLMIVNALEGKPLPVYGDGMQIRDWIHVEDHCEGLLLALARGATGETYNIGGSDERPNRDIVMMICHAVDALLGRAPGTSEKLVAHVADRPGHDRRYAIDSGKVERELGWRPRHSLETALPELVRWYVEHKGWVDSIRSGDYRTFYQKQYAERA